MNPTAIYSKSGKGVQEAAGKTSILKRGDRSVLSAIDGRSTLADVAQKIGKTFDRDFEKIIAQLDKDGFVREVSPGKPAGGDNPAAAKAGKPAAAKPAAPAAPADTEEDLDFSSFSASPPKPAAPPPPKATPKPPPDSSLNKAREEAEARAEADRKRVRAEAEAKVRAEEEAKIRAEAATRAKADVAAKALAAAEAKAMADADAKVKTAMRIAAEAKMKADQETKRAREDTERMRKETEEKVESARREAEELKQRLEVERKAREEAEQHAKDEAEAARKQLEEERKKLEEERKQREVEEQARRKQREEESRNEEAERAARRKREEDEEQARRKQREEEETRYRKEQEERRKREEQEAQERADKKRAEEEERAAKKAEAERIEKEKAAAEKAAKEKAEAERIEKEKAAAEKSAKEKAAKEKAEAERIEKEKAAAEKSAAEKSAKEKAEAERIEKEKAAAEKSAKEKAEAEAAPEKATPAPVDDFAGDLLADLDSFGKQDEEEQKAKEEAEKKAKEDAARKATEDERRAKEEAERKQQEEADRRKREEQERRQKEQEEAREREEAEQKEREENERKERQAEERKHEAKAAMAAQKAKAAEKKKTPARAGADEDDITITDDDLDLDDLKSDQQKLGKVKPREPEYVAPPPISEIAKKRPAKWGKPAAVGLFVLLVAGLGVAHVIPVGTEAYEKAASEALGRPVKIASGRLWLLSGLQLRMEGVTIGDGVKIANVVAFPDFGSLSGEKKTFSRIELNGVSVPQQALGGILFSKIQGSNFKTSRVIAKELELPGPLSLPKKLEADIVLDAEGAPRSLTIRGPDNFAARLAAKGGAFDIEASAGSFAWPIAPDISLSTFAMKGQATRESLTVAEWDAQLYSGSVSGTATVRWGSTWNVDGVVTARGINAAVFAPTLVSEGRGEGTAKFSLSGADPAKLAATGKYEASFTVSRGVLGSFDLSQAIQTGGRQAAGRTSFVEMTGRATYDRGAISVRDVNIGAGAMNAGASADIAQNGALSGRIVADVRTASTTLRATLKDPQVKR